MEENMNDALVDLLNIGKKHISSKKLMNICKYLCLSFQLGDGIRLLKICNFCNKAFIAKNPKAEYDIPQCKNKANVYKSRGKLLNNSVAGKVPSKEMSDEIIKGLKKKVFIFN